MAVWKSSSSRKRAHPDRATAAPVSVTPPAPALLSMQPGGMHALAAAVQTKSVPLLHREQQQQHREQQQQHQEQQQQRREQQQQQQHQEQQGLGRPLQAPGGTPATHQLPQADHVQRVTQLQQGELPGEHAAQSQAKSQGSKQAHVPLASEAKQVNNTPIYAQHAGPAQQAQAAGPTKQAQQAQHAGPVQQAQTAVPAKQAQHAPQQAQQAQHTPQAEHGLLARSPQQRQHALQAMTNTQQAAQHATRMAPEQQAVLPQVAQRVQHAVSLPPIMVSEQSKQLATKRPAPSSDVLSHVKRHKVSICTRPFCSAHSVCIFIHPKVHCHSLWDVQT